MGALAYFDCILPVSEQFMNCVETRLSGTGMVPKPSALDMVCSSAIILISAHGMSQIGAYVVSVQHGVRNSKRPETIIIGIKTLCSAFILTRNARHAERATTTCRRSVDNNFGPPYQTVARTIPPTNHEPRQNESLKLNFIPSLFGTQCEQHPGQHEIISVPGDNNISFSLH